MAQINRSGTVTFHDASLHVWEDPGKEVLGEWEQRFKKEVFKRIVQQLNRLGWKVGPQYHIRTRNNARFCRKGDLMADLHISGRHIELDFFQAINCPTRPDNEGRYESNKEQCMPYQLLLEMQRTRNKLSEYLCNVFAGYEFDSIKRDGRSEKRGPHALTAMEYVKACWASSWHFKGDTNAYEIRDDNRKSADGQLIEQGQRVFYADCKGRMCVGTAYYNINNMWWVVSGKYGVSNEASLSLYVANPGCLRVKRNERQRRQRLERELAKAIKAMDFKRAQVLKDVLSPKTNPFT
ncbi:hypothetical protein ACT3UG_01130 [Halomonas sp. AOP27-A1-34]|uniref:hypothetical protein n=1 Tax=Halomonas sp. AOP27-A1-34 TaxID=3457708 RepID=UPI004033F214